MPDQAVLSPLHTPPSSFVDSIAVAFFLPLPTPFSLKAGAPGERVSYRRSRSNTAMVTEIPVARFVRCYFFLLRWLLGLPLGRCK